MLTVRKDMLTGKTYTGPRIGDDETVVINPDVKEVVFTNRLDLRGMIYGEKTEVMLGAGGRIRHLKAGGTFASKGDVFAGAIEAVGGILIDGNLATWLGDVKTSSGNICVTGDVRSAGGVLAPMGSIAVSGIIEREGKVVSLDTWSGSSGSKITPMAMFAARAADSAMTRLAAIA